MNTRYPKWHGRLACEISRSLVVLLTLALLALLAGPAVCQCNCNPMPGPPCTCSDPSPADGTGAPDCGRPVLSVNLFTGDLLVNDMPLYHQGSGGDIPFVMSYSTHTTENSVLGPQWSHSYNVRLIDNMPYDVTFRDGNLRETIFYYNSVTQLFMAMSGRACRASRESDGQGGWSVHIEKPYFPPPVLPGLNFGQGTGSSVNRQKVTLNSRFGNQAIEFKNADGLTWTFSYDQDGHLSSVSEPNSRSMSFTHTANGKLTRVTNPGGQHADFTYDANGRLSTVTDAIGDTYTYGYTGSSSKITSLTEPSGREIDFDYTVLRGKFAISAISIADSDYLVTYDYSVNTDTGLLYVDVTQTKDGQPRVTRYTYENTDEGGSGRYYGTLLNVIRDYGDANHLNYAQAWAYNANHKVIKYRDSFQAETGGKEHRHWFYYEDSALQFNLTKFIDGENADGNPPTGNCPAYKLEYDTTSGGSFGNLTKVTTPESREVDVNYVSGTHRPSSVVLKDKDYNNNQNDHTASFTYDANHGYQLASVTDPGNHTTNFAYDSNWYLDYIDPPLGNNIEVTADSVGDITSVTDGNGNTTSCTYDELHRPTEITYPSTGNGSKTVTLDWNCCGLSQVTDENGIVTKAVYDQYTRWLTKITEDYGGTGHLNYETEYAHDEVGNVKTVTNARDKVTSYTYNNADMPTRVDYPDDTYETWTYRDDGRVLTHTDGRGRTTTFRYDADDRICGPYSAGYKAIDFPNDTDVYIKRNKDGLVDEVRDASGTSTAAYYPSGWLKTFTNGDSKTVTYKYGADGLLAHMLTPGSLTFDYTYNALNQLDTITNPQSVEVSFSYDNGGRLTRITRPGSYIDYAYNARDWLTSLHNRTTAGATLYDATYAYNDSSLWDYTGNPLKRVENWGGSDYTTTLRYDNVYRLTEETKKNSGGTTQYTFGYTYDAVGNRLTRAKDGTTYTYSYDDNNKVTSASGGGLSASFSYDNNGNMTGVSGTMYGSKSLAYNDSNNLTSLTSAGATDLYYYTAGGQRYLARLAGANVHYTYTGARVLEERNDSDTILSRYTTAGSSYFAPLLHEWRPSGSLSRFPNYDLTGTVRELVDASANVTDTYSLDAFGVKTTSDSGSTPNPYHYGGAWGYQTDRLGFLQLGHRFYWPELGRFLQQDPIGDGMNWYAYANDNPVSYIDADGSSPTLVAAVVGAAGGAIVGGVYSWATGGDWRKGAVRGAIVGGVTGLTLGLGGPAIAGLVGGGVPGGALAGATASAVGDLAGQGYGMLTHQQCGFNGWELAGATMLGGVSGGILLRPSNAPMQRVTSWAPEGVNPTLAPGRWVMVGGRSWLNYLLAGVRQYGYPLENSVTDTVPGSSLSYPSGWEALKGFFGQRIYR